MTSAELIRRIQWNGPREAEELLDAYTQGIRAQVMAPWQEIDGRLHRLMSEYEALGDRDKSQAVQAALVAVRSTLYSHGFDPTTRPRSMPEGSGGGSTREDEPCFLEDAPEAALPRTAGPKGADQ